MGQSYGIVTKNLTPNYVEEEAGIKYEKYGFRSVSKEGIYMNIVGLYNCASRNPDLEFIVAYTTGPCLNGYTPLEIITLFLTTKVPPNVVFNKELINLYYEHKERT